MAQNNDATVEASDNCPRCDSEDTTMTENTAECFDELSGYSSQCEDCGFWFRASDTEQESSSRKAPRMRQARPARDKTTEERLRNGMKGL